MYLIIMLSITEYYNGPSDGPILCQGLNSVTDSQFSLLSKLACYDSGMYFCLPLWRCGELLRVTLPVPGAQYYWEGSALDTFSVTLTVTQLNHLCKTWYLKYTLSHVILHFFFSKFLLGAFSNI